MAKASTLSSLTSVVNSDAPTEISATNIFTKSGYPKTIKENIRLVLNLLLNFGG